MVLEVYEIHSLNFSTLPDQLFVPNRGEIVFKRDRFRGYKQVSKLLVFYNQVLFQVLLVKLHKIQLSFLALALFFFIKLQPNLAVGLIVRLVVRSLIVYLFINLRDKMLKVIFVHFLDFEYLYFIIFNQNLWDKILKVIVIILLFFHSNFIILYLYFIIDYFKVIINKVVGNLHLQVLPERGMKIFSNFMFVMVVIGYTFFDKNLKKSIFQI